MLYIAYIHKGTSRAYTLKVINNKYKNIVVLRPFPAMRPLQKAHLNQYRLTISIYARLVVHTLPL